MRAHKLGLIKLACLVLFVFGAWRAAESFAPSGSTAELDEKILNVQRGRTSALRMQSERSQARAKRTPEEERALTEPVQRLVDSTLFGFAPPPPPDEPEKEAAPPKAEPPTFHGTIGDRAILDIPGSGVRSIRKDEEQEGVKVLDISTNRVLIEVDGQKTELTIYSGVGSDPLLNPKEDQ